MSKCYRQVAGSSPALGSSFLGVRTKVVRDACADVQTHPASRQPANLLDRKMSACQNTQIEVARYCDPYLAKISPGQIRVTDFMLRL